MNEVSIKEDEYIIERAGKPLVAVIQISAYTKYKKEVTEAKNRFFQFIDEVREQNKDVTTEIIGQEIDEAVQAIRKKIVSLNHRYD